MKTFSSTQEKPTQKRSQVFPTNFHLPECKYVALVSYGGFNDWSEPFDSEDEAMLELRCMEKRHSFETIQTVEMEGYFPERAIIMEEKYQQSGRTNGLYCGLNMADGSVPDDNSK
jgi:hypothetical protein